MSSIYKERRGHHEIWVNDGVDKMAPEIREWLDEFAKGKWLGSIGTARLDHSCLGMMHNFSCKETAMLFKLTWG